MNERAGDYDYERHGAGYAAIRRTDPRIAALVTAALGDARTVLNVGAGAGSYEPRDRHVVAVEPSAQMRAQRPRELAPAIIGRAEELPFDDEAFDASMATVTVHQWGDAAAGLAELRRVTRGPVVILTFDVERLERFWLGRYVPEIMEVERKRFPSIASIGSGLDRNVEVTVVPIPFDCEDGFTEAFYGRPERMLDPVVRAAQSSWGFLAPGVEARGIATLEAELRSGAWDRDYGALRTQAIFEGALTLVVSR